MEELDLREVFRKEIVCLTKEHRELLYKVLDSVPKEVWILPASTKYHTEKDKLEYGMLNHAKSVVRICNILSATYDLNTEENSILLTSAILHDICKYGKEADSPKILLKEHPYLAGELIRDYMLHESIELIAVAVEDHMGRWSTRRPRGTPLGTLLHTADMVASNRNVTVEWR